MNFKNFFLLFLVVLLSQVAPKTSFAQSIGNDLRLWYTQPADDWNKALPIGNGSLGAMIFGGVENERIQLNEETVWAGEKEDFVNPLAKKSLAKVRSLLFSGQYIQAQKLAQSNLMGNKPGLSAYQTLADLNLYFDHNELPVSDYRRELDIQNATAHVSYKVNDVGFKRTIFSSAPDKLIVIQLSGDKEKSISFGANLTRTGNRAKVTYDGNEILLEEHVNDGKGVKIVARVKIIAEGGKVTTENEEINVSSANSVLILISGATDYWKGNPSDITKSIILSASRKEFQAMLTAHTQDYQKYFNRVSLDIGKTDAIYFPTDLRLQALQNGSVDPQLIELYYQFGRYLLISCSRPGGLPANLQGIWADGLNPPWDADYHININIQMNYWLAEITGLHEMHLPFLQFLDKLREDGRKTARDMYGINGAVAHFTTDAWHFTEPYGQTQWAMWPMGFAWASQHMWQHFLFSEDKVYLDTLAYPVMKDAAEFCLEWLVQNPETKKLVSGPSISPENTFRTKNGEVATMVMGPTMDHMIIRELFLSTINASLILDRDQVFRKKLEKALEKLTPTKLASDGRIMEWTEEFEEPEPGHRHLSHLYGLYPGNEITSEELLAAARKTIDFRLANGGGHTGWSRAWIINFFARLQDGEAAYSNLVSLLNKSTLPNLFDNHPPFQIDGNFGATAGITEMLVQSHAGKIHVLPALPSAWSSGSVTGICARGGFVIDVEWDKEKLKSIRILSNNGNPCTLQYKEKSVDFKTRPGEVYLLDGRLELID